MASDARARRHTTVVVGCWLPGRRAVTFVARTRSRRDMVGGTGLSIHRGVAAVVTAQAVAGRSRVIHRRR